MREDVTHNQQKSARRCSENLQISKTSLWRILREDLECYPYKIQLVQKIGQNDYEKRLQFERLFIEIIQQEEENYSLLMTDEAHIHLNGLVNKQSFRYWGVENLKISNKRNYIHNAYLCGAQLCATALLAHTSLKTQKALQRVNGERYRHMLNTLRLVVIHLRNRHELWFQQDGATCHIANETMDAL